MASALEFSKYRAGYKRKLFRILPSSLLTTTPISLSTLARVDPSTHTFFSLAFFESGTLHHFHLHTFPSLHTFLITMSSFTALRVLVTLVVATTLMSTPCVGRPLPSPSPISLKFASRQLLSTSSTLPLPPMIIAEQRRAASFTQQRPEPILLKRRDVDDVAPRSDNQEHVSGHCIDHSRWPI